MVDQVTSEEPGLLSKALKVLSVPATAAAGYFFGANHVSNAAYNRAQKHNLIGTTPREGSSRTTPPAIILKEVDAQRAEFAKMASEVTKDASLVIDVAERNASFDKAANAEIKAGMKRLKLDSIRKQWKFIHLSDKQEALMQAFTAAGITLGAMFAIANTKQVSKVFTGKDDESPLKDVIKKMPVLAPEKDWQAGIVASKEAEETQQSR